MLLGDRGYVSELLCHQLDARYGVTMIAIHRANMQPNTPAEQRLFRMHRKRNKPCNRHLEKTGITGLISMRAARLVPHSRLPQRFEL